jgi:gamma-glutamyltranspeptidase / glutathione hydrolase
VSGTAPSAADADLEAAPAAGLTEMPERGPWTISVPGAIHSWGEAHARFGRLAWPDLFRPAMELATGFAATRGWAEAIERSAAVYGEESDWASIYRPHGRAWRVGERVKLPALARTLRQIADEGPQSAYTGSLGRRSAEYLAAAGSPLRPEDFAAYRSEWTEPIAIGYRGLTSLSHPPNSSGPTALEILGLLDRFAPSHSDARWIDLGLRASRIALADRSERLSDPRFIPASTVAELLDPARLDALAADIAAGRDRPTRPPSTPGGTIFLATADDAGGLVSLIESNFRGFGSGVADPQTGISFQNRAASFSLDPSHVNVLAPRKRTLHTLTPGMLLRDGRPWIAHGAMGGAIQPQVFAQFVSAVVDGGLDIAEAVAAPRWSLGQPYSIGQLDGVTLEAHFPADLVAQLEALGHPVTTIEPYSSLMGHANAVERRSDGTFAAASDPRCEGAAWAW